MVVRSVVREWEVLNGTRFIGLIARSRHQPGVRAYAVGDAATTPAKQFGSRGEAQSWLAARDAVSKESREAGRRAVA